VLRVHDLDVVNREEVMPLEEKSERVNLVDILSEVIPYIQIAELQIVSLLPPYRAVGIVMGITLCCKTRVASLQIFCSPIALEIVL
jgi:hypothetical protein